MMATLRNRNMSLPSQTPQYICVVTVCVSFIVYCTNTTERPHLTKCDSFLVDIINSKYKSIVTREQFKVLSSDMWQLYIKSCFEIQTFRRDLVPESS